MPLDLTETIQQRRRIYLVRHGQVTYFDEQGQPYAQKTVPLSTQGVAQAQALAAALRPLTFDRVISTGLPRTDQTARIAVGAAAVAGSEIDGGESHEIQVLEELQEISPGDLEAMRGVCEKDSSRTFEELFVGALNGSVSEKSTFLGGEAFGRFRQRVLGAFAHLLEATNWKELLLVAHGGTNRIILLHALGAGLDAFGSLEQDPACLNIVDVDPDGSFTVRLVNHTSYDPTKADLRLRTMEKIYFDHLAGNG